MAVAGQPKARSSSTSSPLVGPKTPVPAACEPPEKPPAAVTEQKRSSRGLLGRLLPARARSRGSAGDQSESGTERPELEPAAETDQQPERRSGGGQLAKLFHHGKDKHKKHKAKADKKKEAKALLAA